MARRGQIEDLTERIFSRLKVLSLDPVRAKDGNTQWNCECVCGNKVTVERMSLINSTTKSCGCLRTDRFKKLNLKHGLANHKLSKVWQAMRRRCSKPADKAYKDYGGRGIKVCLEWEDLQVFYDWAMAYGYKEGLTIERVNNDGNYEPGNCTWIPQAEQTKNRRPFRRRTREELSKDPNFKSKGVKHG